MSVAQFRGGKSTKWQSDRSDLSARRVTSPMPFPAILRSRIQRNSKAESFLSGCALGPLKCPSNFSRWRLLPSESFQFANVYLGPFTSFRILGHVTSDLKRQEFVTTKNQTAKPSFASGFDSVERSCGDVKNLLNTKTDLWNKLKKKVNHPQASA
jgi:hypothetical protein